MFLVVGKDFRDISEFSSVSKEELYYVFSQSSIYACGQFLNSLLEFLFSMFIKKH